MTQDTVVVTQSARDAAADLYLDVIPFTTEAGAAFIRSGGNDQFPLVQAIAAAEQRGFKLCQEQMAAREAEEGERQYRYFLRTTCPCMAAGRHVHGCPKHGSIKETDNAG